MGNKNKLRPQPGDLVKNIRVPGLDYRVVVAVGIAIEDGDRVKKGQRYVTLDLFGESTPLPAELYRVVKTRAELAA